MSAQSTLDPIVLRIVFGEKIRHAKYAPNKKLVTSTDWVPDSASTSCLLCSKQFGVVRRRHHCRRCGRLFCAKCCPPSESNNDPSNRFCLFCRDILDYQIDSPDIRYQKALKYLKVIPVKDPILVQELIGYLSGCVMFDSVRSLVTEDEDLLPLISKLLAHSIRATTPGGPCPSMYQSGPIARLLLLQCLAFFVNLTACPQIECKKILLELSVHFYARSCLHPGYDLAVREMGLWVLRNLSQLPKISELLIKSTNPKKLETAPKVNCTVALNDLLRTGSDKIQEDAAGLLANMLRVDPPRYTACVLSHDILRSLTTVITSASSPDLIADCGRALLNIGIGSPDSASIIISDLGHFFLKLLMKGNSECALASILVLGSCIRSSASFGSLEYEAPQIEKAIKVVTSSSTWGEVLIRRASFDLCYIISDWLLHSEGKKEAMEHIGDDVRTQILEITSIPTRPLPDKETENEEERIMLDRFWKKWEDDPEVKKLCEALE